MASVEPVHVRARNFGGANAPTLESFCDGQIRLTDVPNPESRVTGFAENHNSLFRSWDAPGDFVLLNPDCVLCDSSIDRLYERKKRCGSGAAIVEGRQWPFEHPKEFDPVSLETPWASGAFSLIDGEFYESVGGMEEAYFLYQEDVDLSWRAWASGWGVFYEPQAVVVHFTGGPFYRRDLEYAEQYFGRRNFIALLYKFFGIEGECLAVQMLSNELSQAVAAESHEAFKRECRSLINPLRESVKHRQIKVLGVDRYHDWRSA